MVWPKQAPGERVKTNVQIIRTYTVTYTDGQGGTLFADVVYRNLQLDATTPKYNDANVPVVAGWEFAGWSPTYAEKVTGNVTYVAQWKTSPITPSLLDLLPADTTFTVTYTDGVEDAVIFNDQATSGLLAGDATPAMPTPSARATASTAGACRKRDGDRRRHLYRQVDEAVYHRIPGRHRGKQRRAEPAGGRG